MEKIKQIDRLRNEYDKTELIKTLRSDEQKIECLNKLKYDGSKVDVIMSFHINKNKSTRAIRKRILQISSHKKIRIFYQ